MAEQRTCLAAELLDRHRGERRGDLLSRRRDCVHLARVRKRRHLMSKPQQAIGLAAHRTHDHDDVIAPPLRLEASTRDVTDAVDRADRSATILLNNERQETPDLTRRGSQKRRQDQDSAP